MGSIVTFANMVTVKGTKGAGVWQAVEEAVDISALDRCDLQVSFLAQAGDGVTAPNGCAVKLFSSMQNTSDIDAMWGTALATADFLGTAPAAWETLIVKADTAALLRYLRWYIAFNTNTQQVTFSIQGIGRSR